MPQEQPQSTPVSTMDSNQPSIVPTKKKTSWKKKILIVVGTVLAAFVGLIIIGAIVGSSVTKYSVTDLVTETKDNISFTRPQHWKNASSIDKLTKGLGLDVTDALVFGDKITKNKDGKDTIANAFVLFGKAGSGNPGDADVFQDPANRAEFEKSMDTKLGQDSFKSDQCESVSNFNKTYNYGLNNMPVSVAIGFRCQLSASQKKSQNAEYTEMRMAIVVANNGNTYLYVLVANDKSWAKNEDVYRQMMMDFKAQP